MFSGPIITLMHEFVSVLLYPIIVSLGCMMVLAVWEIGIAIGERFWGLQAFPDDLDRSAFEQSARRRP